MGNIKFKPSCSQKLPQMDLRKLGNIISVAECGSFSRAAMQLGISQSVLSRQIRSVEEDVGIRLMERTGRGIVMTDVGEEFVVRAKKLLDEAEKLFADMRQQSGVVDGTVHLGVCASVSHLLLTKLLEEVGREHPSIQLRIVETMSGKLKEFVSTGSLDLVVFFSTQNGDKANSEFLVGLPSCVVARADDPVVANDSFPFDDLRHLQLIMPSAPHGIRHAIEVIGNRRRIPINICVEVNGLSTMKSLLSSGDKYAVLSYAAVANEVKAGVLRASRIVDPVVNRDLLLAHSTEHPVSDATRAVAKILRRQIKKQLQSDKWPTMSLPERA